MTIVLDAPGNLDGWGLRYLIVNAQYQAIAAFNHKRDAERFLNLWGSGG